MRLVSRSLGGDWPHPPHVRRRGERTHFPNVPRRRTQQQLTYRDLDTVDEIDPQALLFQLANHLDHQKFQVTRTENSIIVGRPDVDITLTIRCSPRASDEGRWWFIADIGVPLGQAERLYDAAMAIKTQFSPSP